MNEEQIKLAVQTGLRMFSPGSNVTGVDLPDATGAHYLKQLLLILAQGNARIVPSELLEKQPDKGPDHEPPENPQPEEGADDGKSEEDAD